ncbi:unnamed protein product [Notodromas monacha]|uniref:Uncharacterized protein n=1 Tax=Notodromas monacha TaxID=399045 RepID=A0A7R9G8I8_9CRUS|nr:unnamed protein product [Notodromas monacha]CAG0913215.1 unnamed protein product [Notodromas monacha]
MGLNCGTFLRRFLYVLLIQSVLFCNAEEPCNSSDEKYCKTIHKFMTSGIIPDVLETTPPRPLNVQYEGGVQATFGNELKPSETAKEPKLSASELNPEKLYTLIMVDPDAPSRANPLFRSWLHWLVINIPGQQISKGQVIFPYAGPAPPKGTGQHRYYELMFEQQKHVDLQTAINSRSSFNTRAFIKAHGLGNVFAGNFFLAQNEG